MENEVLLEGQNFPPVMSTPEAAAYLAGKKPSARVNVQEFVRFAERFRLEPVDVVGGGSRNRGESTVRQKWSKRHIDLVLLTGMRWRDALKWAQQAPLHV